MINQKLLYQDINHIQSQAPVIHNITNLVVTHFTANILLAIGASPIMAHAPEELEEISALSNALVLNIGTLDQSWIQSMLLAQQMALAHHIPIVLDPVGAGASTLRNKAVERMLNKGVTVLKGNASEIKAIAGEIVHAKGVDSSHDSFDAVDAAKKISETYHCTVVISGAQDYIVDKEKTVKINNGHPIMCKVTGMGCAASAIMGAFLAVNHDSFMAAVHAMSTMAMAGELAAKKSAGPGSFVNIFLDQLYTLTPSIFLSLKDE